MKARLNGFSAKDGMQHANDNKKLGKMRRLDASDERSIDHPSHKAQWFEDERSIDHPSHKAQWFEIARAIGRQIARDERDGCSGQHIGG